MDEDDASGASVSRPRARIESTPRAATMARSIRGSADSNSAERRTSFHSRKALCRMMSLARSGSLIPASSTIRRSSPTFWMRGSETPNSSIRVRMMRSTREIPSAFASGVSVPSGSSISSARCIPPSRSSPRFRGVE